MYRVTIVISSNWAEIYGVRRAVSFAMCALAKLRVRHLGKIDKETNSAFIPIVGIPWPAALLLHSRSIDAHRTREPGRKRIANVFRVQGKARGDYVGCVYVPNGRDRGMQL